MNFLRSESKFSSQTVKIDTKALATSSRSAVHSLITAVLAVLFAGLWTTLWHLVLLIILTWITRSVGIGLIFKSNGQFHGFSRRKFYKNSFNGNDDDIIDVKPINKDDEN